ncbi:MAG: lipid-A-disaccharide synthase, partial [Cyanobacteriota bacterium]
MDAIDIVILSNGPGEITTWVKPMVRSLRSLPNADSMRISVVLSPCPHALGNEAAIARNYPEVDRVQSAEHFLRFLLFGKTAENWNWRKKGVVVFLGGDQVFPLIIGKRLGYKTVIYAEWDARWYRWIDAFGIRNAKIFRKIPPRYHSKCTIVGDLMLDVSAPQPHSTGKEELIGLLPGSKPAKLAQGVPFSLAIAEAIHRQRPQTRFLIPVAPTLDLRTLAKFANPKTNPVIAKIGNVSGDIIEIDKQLYIETSGGLKIELYTDFPAYEILSQCRLC